MPESKKRKKPVPTGGAPSRTVKKKGPSPRWLVPLMLALFGVGLAWLVVFYVTSPTMPVFADLGNGNLLVGFAFIIAGFGIATQWR